jgi:subtilisin family serine protease
VTRLAALLGLAVLVAPLEAPTGPPAPAAGPNRSYLVLYRSGSPEAGRVAIRQAGGTIVGEIPQIGLARVTSRSPRFLSQMNGSGAVVGAMVNLAIGHAPVPRAWGRDQRLGWEAGAPGRAPGAGRGGGRGPETFADRQWGMRMIDATVGGSYAVEPGNPGVLVGIMDTGIDASHPDLAANFSHELSRNFTKDIPTIDGACADDPDGSCHDPADVDEEGHGTHVAGIVAAALNGFGVSGVAPDVTLVSLRAGQDSGLFFLDATLEGWIHAAGNGIDIVNMSFFTDPWLFNCLDNPKDAPRQRREQLIIREASQRAIDYAHRHGVTLIASAGNDFLDLDRPESDVISPNHPPGASYRRAVDDSCTVVPTEARHVLPISALGPSGRKAYYSNFGMDQIVVSAPGGDRLDLVGTPGYETPRTRILSTYPLDLAAAEGTVDGDRCTALDPLRLTEDVDGECAVYAYLQGTSMAAPHASGVAAVIVSALGVRDAVHGGLTMRPEDVRRILEDTATETPCLVPGDRHYPGFPEGSASCVGTTERNGFFGHGIVNAHAAATS